MLILLKHRLPINSKTRETDNFAVVSYFISFFQSTLCILIGTLFTPWDLKFDSNSNEMYWWQ